MNDENFRLVLGEIKGHTQQILGRIEKIESQQTRILVEYPKREELKSLLTQPERCRRIFVSRGEVGAIVAMLLFLIAAVQVLFSIIK